MKFARAEEISWNKDTLISILSTAHERKARWENFWSFFLYF